MEHLILRKPAPEDRAAVWEYREEFLSSGEKSVNGSASLHRAGDFDQWMAVVAARENLPSTDEDSAASTFLAVRQGDGKIVGTIQVRHRLTEELLKSGGNIGYAVRPSERKKGYATQMLRLALDFAKSLGLRRVLLDCDVGNIASEKTILACGGVFENEVKQLDENGETEHMRRFWIAIKE